MGRNFYLGGAMIVGEYHSLWVILLMVSILALFGTMWVVGGPPGNIKDLPRLCVVATYNPHHSVR